MEILGSLPLDEGFLRRECPHCEREFKWYHGATADRPDDAVDPVLYYCPYCGESAGLDQWWTKEQIEFSQRALAGPMTDMATEMLRDATRGMNTSGGLFSLSMSVDGDRPPAPSPLTEPADMVMVASPCHSYEPIKVADDWTEPLHCLVCGAAFVLPPPSPE